jgi:Kef-type K+ transport system membrane component KefB
LLLFVFAVVLLVALLLSALAHRTVLSTAVVCLAAGFLVGDGVLGIVHVSPASPVVSSLSELALFPALFTDGMRVGWADLRSAWKLPGRALASGCR